MTRKLRDPIPDHIAEAQRRAADPRVSVWVKANAGSGKTHVLTERVLRLLLSGVAPEQILCLTYTKAAAAEMHKRVSARLAAWTHLSDPELDRELQRMEARPPSRDMRGRARTLFAHALETPGGLKIVTIHAFCESVLHRFPREAGVPFDFKVIEDFERDGMILRARETILAGGLKGDPATGAAVETLFALLSDSQIEGAISSALAENRKLRPILADRPSAKERLRKLVQAGGGRQVEAILGDISGNYGLDADTHRAILALTPPRPDGSGFEDRLARLDLQHPDPHELLTIFLTGDQTVPKRFPKKALGDADPLLADRLLAEAQRLEGLAAELNTATLIARSEALLDILGAISDRYETEKRARSLLDFDDLIERLGALFRDPGLAPWVQYKLDAGITHILLDESQDTNREQWDVVTALANEFFVGDSAVERPRTIFAVGDEKQSIYSFQGADPSLFGQAGRRFGEQSLRVDKAFETVPLHTSFRTLPAILEAVDLTFSRADIREGVLAPIDDPVAHDTARADPGGMVTLWPPIREDDNPADSGEWPLEVPKSLKSAPRQVAERIAREIRSWIDSGRPLGPRGRAVGANDILILVQARNTLFGEIIRALIREKLPTPGADRLAITSHIGVLDLMALGDVLLNPADDLQLAALLRSPLFDVTEDDLLALAQPRPRGASLWDALAATDIDAARAAYERLLAWRSKLDFERPYEFFAEVLYAGRGLERFHARLGAEIDDVMAEFLDLALAHETSPQPSLQGFLSAMRARDVTIKRELAEAGGGVRVMTVHGAKGLEAPIVILADAASRPRGSQLGKPVLILSEPPGPLLIHAPGKKDHVAETLPFRERDAALQGAEYWRKLYVGMTRAEDELYVTGTLTRKGSLEATWYQAILQGLEPDCETVPDPAGGESALVFPRERPIPTPIAGGKPAAREPAQALRLAVLPERPIRTIIRPSSAHQTADPERVLETRIEESLDADAARKAGVALHALLQHLGRLDRAVWPLVAGKALEVLLPERPDLHEGLANKAVAILGRPDFQPLFGPHSRGEVPFLMQGRRDGAPVTFAGRIDRLIVTDGTVWVVDYKSDASPPVRPQAVPSPYLTQLAIYALIAGQLFPGREVVASILWTAPESLMNLPRELLGPAASTFTIG